MQLLKYYIQRSLLPFESFENFCKLWCFFSCLYFFASKRSVEIYANSWAALKAKEKKHVASSNFEDEWNAVKVKHWWIAPCTNSRRRQMWNDVEWCEMWEIAKYEKKEKKRRREEEKKRRREEEKKRRREEEKKRRREEEKKRRREEESESLNLMGFLRGAGERPTFERSFSSEGQGLKSAAMPLAKESW